MSRPREALTADEDIGPQENETDKESPRSTEKKEVDDRQGPQHPVSLRRAQLCQLTVSILLDAGLPRCSAPQEGHLLSIYTGPELVLPGPAMRPSCHTNYTAVTTCRGTVRSRTLSVLRALRPLPSIRVGPVSDFVGAVPSYVAISSKAAPYGADRPACVLLSPSEFACSASWPTRTSFLTDALGFRLRVGSFSWVLRKVRVCAHPIAS